MGGWRDVEGRTAEERRKLQRETERTVHDCGSATTSRRGIVWIDNDVVNFLSTVVGGLLAASLVR